jgi:hypothetical protein
MLWPLARAEADEPAPGPRPWATSLEASVNLFLGGPGELDALLKSLQNPDFVLMKGEEYRRLVERGGVAAGARDLAAVVDSVAIEGTIRADRADFSVEAGITLRSDGPAWVPIRLDEQTVTGAREGERELPLQVVGGGWQVELRGAGAHRVRVDLKVPLRTTVEGRRVEFAIPEAASTRFSWVVADRVTDAATGSGELVEVEPIGKGGGAGSRLAAHLTPRARLDVSWRVEAEQGVQLPPLLTMQGEIAIDIDPASFRTRSTWAVHAVRGSTRSLELRLDPADEVLELELDGQPVPAGIERVDGSMLLAIALTDPLRPGLPKSLVMTTRRPISTAASAIIAFNGFALTNAKEQSGAIGIAQSGNLWIGGTPGRGLRRIDPRTELPPDLRARPSTALAYAFADQPFELTLRADPSPPLVRTDARTTVTLDAGQARVETWLDYRAAHGRLFDLNIGLPDGLELESVGPKDIVEASQQYSAEAEAGAAARRGMPAHAAGTRAVTVRLTPQAQEGDSFSIQLTGRQAIEPARPVDLALFRPLDATSGGGRVAVLTGRNLTVDLRDGGGGPGAFRPAAQEPPADWPWPAADRPAGVSPAPALWLRHDGSPAALPLEMTVHPRALAHRTILRVQVERRWLVIEQEIECSVHFGTLDHLDVEVPSALRGRWEPEKGEVASQAELGSTPGGDLLVRLALGKEVRDKVRLRFRIRRPLSPRPEPGRPAELEVPWIRPMEGKALPMQVRVASDPSIDLEPRGAGWVRAVEEEASFPVEPGLLLRFVLVGASPQATPLGLVAEAHPMADLPPLVASRLWLRTEQGPEYDLRTTAVYSVETHESSLAVALPPGAVWERAKVGGVTVGQVVPLPKSSGYRLAFPDPRAGGHVVVELEYTIPASHAKGPWLPPRLLEGGLVQQTLWEVRVPWGRAVVGVPSGWTDENTWAWDGFSFRRRSRQGVAALAAWAGGPPAQGTGSPAVADGFDDAAAGVDQSFLFGRPGQPSDLRLLIASRGWLVGICSGTVLVLGGLLILFRRPSPRLSWLAALGLGLAGSTIVQPSVTFLAVQSAMLGVVLTCLTALMQRQVHRRGFGTVFGEAGGGLGGAVPSGSTVSRTVGVGSDDSTAIRVRPNATTVDHYTQATPTPSTPEREGADGRGPPLD